MLADLWDLLVFILRCLCLGSSVAALGFAGYSFFVRRFDPWVRYFFIAIGLATLALGLPVFF